MGATLLGRLRGGVEALRGDGVAAVLARGSLGSFLVRLLAAGAAFGLQIFLTRLLGPDEFGRYVYVLSWVTFTSQIGVLGFDTASLRFVSALEARGQWSLLRGFLRRSLQVTIAASLLGALLLVTAAWVLRTRLDPRLFSVMLAASCLLPLVAILQVVVSQVNGLKKVVAGQGIQGLLRPAVTALVLACGAWLGWHERSAVAAMLASAAATAASIGAAGWLLRRLLHERLAGHAPAYDTHAWLRTAFPLLLITASQIILSQTDVLMIGAMRNTTDAGIYAVASQLASIVTFAIMAANAIVAPLIASLYAQGHRAELQRLLTMTSRGVLAYALPVVAGLLLLGRWVLSLYGPAFGAGYVSLLILSVGQLTIALCGSVGFLLTMTGHEQVATKVIGGSAALNVVLNLLLIPSLGLVGAAIATAIATAARSLILSIYVDRLLGLDATALGRGGQSSKGTRS